jgi:hypothetical protein
MDKKMTNNDPQYTTQKIKDWATHTTLSLYTTQKIKDWATHTTLNLYTTQKIKD